MRGIDISHWKSDLNLQHAKKAGCEFVIVKATQGTSYKDATRTKFILQAQNLGMLTGMFHFAAGYNPESEATHFYNTVKSHIGKSLMILDYEINCDSKIYGSNRQWIERFVTKFYQLANRYPLLYCDSRYLSQMKSSWVVDKCPLWLARYPKRYRTWTNDKPPAYAPWNKLTIWQFTSSLRIEGYTGDLDGNIAYITANEWENLAGGKTQQTANKTKKPTAQIVSNIVSNKYGAGAKRKRILTELGYNPTECQKLVNEYYSIANKVIKGKYGTGADRKKALEKLGYNYAVVQQVVNILVG